MPILNITVSGKYDAALSMSVAGALSGATKIHLGKDPDLTAVIINYVSQENWFAGGKSLASQGLMSFWLDIKVTAATNTKSEFADYIQAVFGTMARLLGALHGASYIVVHEVPAAAWGFAGKTQEYRFVAGKINITNKGNDHGQMAGTAPL